MLSESHDEEQIIARVAALDIGKAEVLCCVRVPGVNAKRRRQEVSTHSTMTRSLTELANHLVELGVERVVMEATSDYWRPVFYLFEAHGLQPWLVNARDVKHLPGRPKTDVLDAVWLCKVSVRPRTILRWLSAISSPGAASGLPSPQHTVPTVTGWGRTAPSSGTPPAGVTAAADTRFGIASPATRSPTARRSTRTATPRLAPQRSGCPPTAFRIENRRGRPSHRIPSERVLRRRGSTESASARSPSPGTHARRVRALRRASRR